jgi:exosortase K
MSQRVSAQKEEVKLITRSKAKTFLLENGIFYALGLVIALGLKYYYSGASSDALHWILVPTSRLVEYLSGIHFEKELHSGLVSHSHRYIIASSCAGINFLTIAFSTFFFSLTYRLRSIERKLLWLGISLAVTYFLTLGANALRVIAAIYLYRADIYGRWMTPERVHRIEGTLIYFVVLLFAYVAVERIVDHFLLNRSGQGKNTIVQRKTLLDTIYVCLIPLFCYSFIALGIPLLNVAHELNRMKYMEHSFWVISSCFTIVFLLFLIQFVYRKATDHMKQRKRK